MRTPTPQRLGVAALLGLGLLALGAAPAQAQNRRGRPAPDANKPGDDKDADQATIVMAEGRSFEGVDIKELKFASIKFRERGRNNEVKGEDVAELRWTNPPPLYATGLSQLRAGLYERAVQSFTSARNAAKDGSWVKVFATYQLAEAQRLLGTPDSLKAAADEYKSVLDADAQHFIAPNAIYGQGLALVAAAKYADAVASFKKLDTGFGDLWRLRGKVGEGNALISQGRGGDARSAFEIANQSALRYPTVRREAQVGIGRAFVLDKRYDDAVKFFDTILEQPGVEPEVAGGAWVGKGDCRYEQATGGGKQDKNTLKEALKAYQTCVVRYAGVPEVYPKALYQSAVIYRALGLEALAGHMEEELRSRCPNSPYTGRLKR